LTTKTTKSTKGRRSQPLILLSCFVVKRPEGTSDAPAMRVDHEDHEEHEGEEGDEG